MTSPCPVSVNDGDRPAIEVVPGLIWSRTSVWGTVVPAAIAFGGTASNTGCATNLFAIEELRAADLRAEQVGDGVKIVPSRIEPGVDNPDRVPVFVTALFAWVDGSQYGQIGQGLEVSLDDWRFKQCRQGVLLSWPSPCMRQQGVDLMVSKDTASAKIPPKLQGCK